MKTWEAQRVREEISIHGKERSSDSRERGRGWEFYPGHVMERSCDSEECGRGWQLYLGQGKERICDSNECGVDGNCSRRLKVTAVK